MNLLLDTHVFIWWMEDHSRLNRHVRDVMTSPRNHVLVSAVTVWEISIKIALGKLSIPEPMLPAMTREGFAFLPVGYPEADMVAKLPMVHKDPFDRLLVAQTIVHDCVLLTSDRQILGYEIPVMDCGGGNR
jgi:PIN domain nuclease of toxin-antitoxin system